MNDDHDDKDDYDHDHDYDGDDYDVKCRIIGTQVNAVSYTHLTLPTKRIV